MKRISVALVLIIVGAVVALAGGVLAYKYLWMSKEKTQLTATTPSEEIAIQALSNYLNSYTSADIPLSSRLKSYLINKVTVDITESGCFGFIANFSVETLKNLNNGFTVWTSGSGSESGNWVNNKIYNFNVVRGGDNYRLENVGTSRSSRSCVGGAENQTTDWKTYVNKDYGFEMKYPKSWSYGINLSDVNSVVFCPPELTDLDNPELGCKWQDTNMPSPKPTTDSPIFLYITKKPGGSFTLSNLGMKDCLSSKQENINNILMQISDCGERGLESIFYGPGNTNVYRLLADKLKYVDIFNRILPTFKFTK